MSKHQFWIECEKRTVSPYVALECEAVALALRSGDAAAVIKALDENF